MDNSLARSPLHGHIIFGIVSLVLMCGLSGMLGTYQSRLSTHKPAFQRAIVSLEILTDAQLLVSKCSTPNNIAS